MRVAAFALSALVHLLALYIMFWRPPQLPAEPGDAPPGTPINVELLPKMANEELKKFPQLEEGTPLENPITEKKLCSDNEDSYIGIGIVYSIYSMVILDAPTHYPGYRAGLRVNDTLLDGPQSHKNAVVGEFVTYRVLRGTNELTFRIKTEQICFRPKI